jgi:hypothetical protein
MLDGNIRENAEPAIPCGSPPQSRPREGSVDSAGKHRPVSWITSCNQLSPHGQRAEPPYRDRPTGRCGLPWRREGSDGAGCRTACGPRVPGFRSMCLLRRALPWRGPGRGASAWRRSGIRDARCGLSGRLVTNVECADGSDDRDRPASGLAHRGGGRCGRGAAGRVAGSGLPGAGREAGRLGGGVAGADLGGGGRPGAGRPAGPAAGGRW